MVRRRPARCVVVLSLAFDRYLRLPAGIGLVRVDTLANAVEARPPRSSLHAFAARFCCKNILRLPLGAHRCDETASAQPRAVPN